MLHSVYLPFTKEQLLKHFAKVKKNGKCKKNANHLEYYRKSIEKYKEYEAKNPDRKGKPLKETKLPCQIEKDERFWIAKCMLTLFYSPNRMQELIHICKNAYGKVPLVNIDSWQECFEGDLHLFFEPNLPSPKSYSKWLSENLTKRHIVPYVLDSSHGKKRLEGPTNVDAVLLNSENGFAVIIEAKVLSDISVQITYDILRNQIARNIDVMLEKNDNLCPPLKLRDPDRTLFLLITPKIFKENPQSRLYGYKFNEYKSNPDSIGFDLPHRSRDWEKMSKRLGWLTWADLSEL